MSFEEPDDINRYYNQEMECHSYFEEYIGEVSYTQETETINHEFIEKSFQEEVTRSFSQNWCQPVEPKRVVPVRTGLKKKIHKQSIEDVLIKEIQKLSISEKQTPQKKLKQKRNRFHRK